MNIYRRVQVRFWLDKKIRTLREPSKLLALYLLTGPQTTSMPGLFRAGRATIADDIGWSIDQFESAWSELPAGFAEADWSAHLVYLPNALRHNPPENPNIVVGWGRALAQLPECDLLDRALVDWAAWFAKKDPAMLRAFGRIHRHAFAPEQAKPSVERTDTVPEIGSRKREQEEGADLLCEEQDTDPSLEGVQGESTNQSEVSVPKRTPPGGTKRASRCPESTDDGAEAWLASFGTVRSGPGAGKPAIPSLGSEDGSTVANFLDHHASRGNTMVNWPAAWRTWRAKAARGWGGGPGKGPAPGHGKPAQARNLGLPPLRPFMEGFEADAVADVPYGDMDKLIELARRK